MVKRKYTKKQHFKENSLREPRLNRICCCEDLDFYWDESELKELNKLWNIGMSILEMSEHFERDTDEVIVALIHLARTDKIKQRKGGLLV